jgi:hypothetical protein
MKIKVPVMDVPMNVIIDTDDPTVRKVLTDAGLTFPPEKKVEPVEFHRAGDTIILVGASWRVARKWEGDTKEENRRRTTDLFEQLVIQANFAKRFWDKANSSIGRPAMRNIDTISGDSWIGQLYSELKSNLKGA